METIKNDDLRWVHLGSEYREGAVPDWHQCESNKGTQYIILQRKVTIINEDERTAKIEWRDIPVVREYPRYNSP